MLMFMIGGGVGVILYKLVVETSVGKLQLSGQL